MEPEVELTEEEMRVLEELGERVLSQSNFFFDLKISSLRFDGFHSNLSMHPTSEGKVYQSGQVQFLITAFVKGDEREVR